MKNVKSISRLYVSLIGLVIIILSACTHGIIDEGGGLQNDELVFIQSVDGTVTGGVPVNSVDYTEIESNPGIGGFVETKNGSGESVYWVPEYENRGEYEPLDPGADKGIKFALLDTENGRPVNKPTSAKVKKIVTKHTSAIDNEIFIYLDILSGDQLVDGFTHIYANSPNGDIKFFDFFRDIIPESFVNAVSTPTIFGHYDLEDISFGFPYLEHFDKLDETAAKDGEVLLYLKVGNNQDHFTLDLYSGPKTAENKISTLDIVLPNWEGELEAKLTGPSTILLDWPEVANDNNFVGYRVYKDGEKIVDLPEVTTSHQVGNLAFDETYNFSVFALYEINGNIIEGGQDLQTNLEIPLRVIPKDNNVHVESVEWLRIDETDTFIFMPIDLPEGTTLFVKDVSNSTVVTEADGIEVAGDILNFDFSYPNGQQPTEPFMLKMSYDDSFNTDTDIYYYNESNNEWEKQTGTKDEIDKVIEIQPAHFSTYGVFALSEEEGGDNAGEGNEGEDNESEDNESGDNEGEDNEGEDNEGDGNENGDNESENNEGDNNEDENNESGNEAGETNDDNSKQLPKTASPFYNYLLIGFLLMIIGTVSFIWSKKKNTIKP